MAERNTDESFTPPFNHWSAVWSWLAAESDGLSTVHLRAVWSGTPSLSSLTLQTEEAARWQRLFSVYECWRSYLCVHRSMHSFIDLRCQRRSLSLSLYWPHTCIEVKAAAHSITRCSEYLPKSNWDRHPRFSTKSSLREFAESSQILSSFLAKGHLGFGSRCLTTRRKPWNLFLFLYFLLNLQNKIIIRAKALLTCQALWLKAFRSLTGDFVLGVWGLISLLQGGVRHRLQRPDCRGGLYLYVCDAAVPRALLHTQSLQTLLWNI